MLSYALVAILSREKSEKPGIRMWAKIHSGFGRDWGAVGQKRLSLEEVSVDRPCGGWHLYSVHEFGH
jgi:hypothetical protein